MDIEYNKQYKRISTEIKLGDVVTMGANDPQYYLVIRYDRQPYVGKEIEVGYNLVNLKTGEPLFNHRKENLKLLFSSLHRRLDVPNLVVGINYFPSGYATLLLKS